MKRINHRASFIFAAALFLLTSCGQKTILEDRREFRQDVWNRFTPEVFDIGVKNNRDYYNIDFTVEVDTSIYRYDNVPFLVELDSPAGEHRQFFPAVMLKEHGVWRGTDENGYRKVKGRIRNYFSFNHEGKHRMSVKHTTPQFDLEGIHALTVTVERTKVDYGDL